MKTPLPAPGLRKAGSLFRRDDVFVGGAILDAAKLKWGYGLAKDTAILDIGCGPGRTLIGILEAALPYKSYTGIDVQRPQIDWATNNLGKHGRFLLSDARNARYSPRGKVVDNTLRLPITDASIDLVVCASLFTHMRLADTQIYLKEISRVLRPGGCAYITAFVRYAVPSETVNPSNYPPGVRNSGALLRVLLSDEALASAINAAGLRHARWFEESLPNYQTEIKLVKE